MISEVAVLSLVSSGGASGTRATMPNFILQFREFLRKMLEGLQVAQFATFVGTVLIGPAMAFYVQAKIAEGQSRLEKQLLELKLSLAERDSRIERENEVHKRESQMRYELTDKRLTMLEGERDAFHERFNQIQLNITSALAENRQNHLEANTRRAQGAPGD